MQPIRLNNLKIRFKLVLFLIIPILTLLYFSISGINLKYQEKNHTEWSLSFISLSLIFSDLLYELQKERGLSAGFVGSRGTLYREVLLKQRKKTDENIYRLIQKLNRKNLRQTVLNSTELFSRIQPKLEKIKTMRIDIDSLNKGYFFDDYSEINAMILNLIMHLQTLIKNSELSRYSDAYNTLLWLQERSGQERGLLNGVFSAGRLSATQFKELSAYSTEQKTLINRFFTVAPLQQREQLQNRMKHPVMADVKALQTAAINKAIKNDLLNGLQILIGYGGLIHNFKNYVIRGQQLSIDKFDNLYVRAIIIINRYRKLPGMSLKEIDSLNTIEATFLEYKKLLKITKRLRREGKNISEIDSFVKVDDKLSLDAIQYLHKSVTGLDTGEWWSKATTRIQLIKEVSDFIRADMLNNANRIRLATKISLNIYLLLTIVSLSLTSVLGYLLIQRLVGGVIYIAENMTSMQKQKDFGRTIEVGGNDEISDVARAFNKLIEEGRKSEEKLKLAASVFKGTNEAITVTDAMQRITMVNPAFTTITGYTQKEVLGKNPSILKSGKHDKIFYKKMWATLFQEGHWIGEIQNRRKNGEIYPEMLNISVIKDDQGKIIMYIGMFLDITKHKQAEEKQDLLQRQLLQAQKMESLGQLTGGIAHDFNNMLAAILGYTSLAVEYIKEKNKDEKLQDYLNEITLAGNRAKQVVTQLLAFSRSGVGSELQVLDVADLLNESIEMIRPLLPSTIELFSQISSDETKLMANPVMIHQVLMNLCINARDSIIEYGRIEFEINKILVEDEICSSCHKPISGDFIEVSITDTGTGIDAKNFVHLFDPFFTTKEIGSEKGTGMGLAMVHGIIHEHDGHIIVDSTVGKGSKFSLLFHLYRGKDITESEIINSSEDNQVNTIKSIDRATGYNILCVDDEQSLVTLMKEILEDQGHHVTAFTDSEMALLNFKEQPNQYDLVITDQTMPKLTGAEMAKAMIQIQENILIILCSGYSENFDKTDAEIIGVMAYLEKPLDIKFLFELINKLKVHARP